MKKLQLLVVMMAIAIAASATGHFKANVRQLHHNPIKKENVLSKQNAALTKKDVMNSKAARVITSQPEGTSYDYQASGRADYAYEGFLNVDNISGTVRVVFAEDGTVYLRNLLFHSGDFYVTNWVQGTIEDNVLTIPLGQSIYYDDEYDADIALAWGEVVIGEDGDIDFVRDETVTEVKYLIGEDGAMTMQGGIEPTSDEPWEDEAYLGTGLAGCWTDDGSWCGICNFSHVLSNPVETPVIPTVITEQPEGELRTYMRTGACVFNAYPGYGSPGVIEQTGKMFVVLNAEAGKAYIQRVSYWHEFAEGWVEGTYDETTGIISIPVGQYVYYSEMGNYGIQMMWGSTTTYQDLDPNTGASVYYLDPVIDEEVTDIKFQIEGDYITLLGSEGDMNAEYPDNMVATGVYWHFTDDLHMTALEYDTKGKYFLLVPAVPADPVDVEWHDSGSEDGGSHLVFTPQTVDVDGNDLDTESLGYSIYTDDDQLFTFEASTYFYDFREDVTVVPHELFKEGYDFSGGYEITEYEIFFYRTNADGFEPFFNNRIGIQAVYTVDDGTKALVENRSNIVYYELGNTAICDVKTDAQVNGPIYNLLGQKMNGRNLPAGIYIQNGRKFIVK